MNTISPQAVQINGKQKLLLLLLISLLLIIIISGGAGDDRWEMGEEGRSGKRGKERKGEERRVEWSPHLPSKGPPSPGEELSF